MEMKSGEKNKMLILTYAMMRYVLANIALNAFVIY